MLKSVDGVLVEVAEPVSQSAMVREISSAVPELNTGMSPGIDIGLDLESDFTMKGSRFLWLGRWLGLWLVFPADQCWSIAFMCDMVVHMDHDYSGPIKRVAA